MVIGMLTEIFISMEINNLDLETLHLHYRSSAREIFKSLRLTGKEEYLFRGLKRHIIAEEVTEFNTRLKQFNNPSSFNNEDGYIDKVIYHLETVRKNPPCKVYVTSTINPEYIHEVPGERLFEWKPDEQLKTFCNYSA